MKKSIIVFLVCISMFGCSREDAGKEVKETNNTPEIVQQQSKQDKEHRQDDKLKSDVISYLQKNGEEEPKITITKSRVEIRLYSDFSDSSAPENWDSVIEHNVNISSSLKDEIPKLDGKKVNVVVYGREKSILLNIIDGECTFDIYNSSETDQSDQHESDENSPIKSGQYTLPSGMNLQFWDSVRNDATGNLRRSATSDSLVPADYALEYYKTMFSSDDEIHAIWNATLKTTTRITVSGNLLFADTLEYVEGEEHDAKILFSGTLLDSRVIDLETGDSQSQENEPETPETNIENSSSDEGDGNNFNTYDNEDQQNTSETWVLNTNTMKIHYPSCSQVKKISTQNYSTSSLSESELIAQGYTTCGVCH